MQTEIVITNSDVATFLADGYQKQIEESFKLVKARIKGEGKNWDKLVKILMETIQAEFTQKYGAILDQYVIARSLMERAFKTSKKPYRWFLILSGQHYDHSEWHFIYSHCAKCAYSGAVTEWFIPTHWSIFPNITNQKDSNEEYEEEEEDFRASLSQRGIKLPVSSVTRKLIEEIIRIRTEVIDPLQTERNYYENLLKNPEEIKRVVTVELTRQAFQTNTQLAASLSDVSKRLNERKMIEEHSA